MSPIVTILSPVMTNEQRKTEWDKVQKVVWEIIKKQEKEVTK